MNHVNLVGALEHEWIIFPNQIGDDLIQSDEVHHFSGE
jgi:hypothetical protein